jgi:hypothetical protein
VLHVFSIIYKLIIYVSKAEIRNTATKKSKRYNCEIRAKERLKKNTNAIIPCLQINSELELAVILL